MSRITNAVLAERIENLHEDVRRMNGTVRQNTEFRLQFKGVIAGFTALAAFLGTIGGWLVTRLLK